jgi:hypothetical protein
MAGYGRAYNRPEPDERIELYDRDDNDSYVPGGGPINRHLERLTKSIYDQNEVLEALKTAIAPVMGAGMSIQSESIETTEIKSSGIETESPMAMMIRDLERKVSQNTREIRAIFERVEL